LVKIHKHTRTHAHTHSKIEENLFKIRNHFFIYNKILEEMKKPLDDYCEEHFGDIVKILRPPKRLGLIAAKNYGGRQATGDVVVFLDAHIEANEGWY
jgi:hypothetical protein